MDDLPAMNLDNQFAWSDKPSPNDKQERNKHCARCRRQVAMAGFVGWPHYPCPSQDGRAGRGHVV